MDRSYRSKWTPIGETYGMLQEGGVEGVVMINFGSPFKKKRKKALPNIEEMAVDEADMAMQEWQRRQKKAVEEGLIPATEMLNNNNNNTNTVPPMRVGCRPPMMPKQGPPLTLWYHKLKCRP